MRKIILVLSVILLASIYNIVEAADLPTFPAKVKVAGKELVRNGMGMRYATIFKVKVYRAALYLLKKETSAEKIIASTEPKRLDMVFVREVSKEKIQNGWKKGFKNNKVDTKKFELEYKKEMDALNSGMKTMNDGDKMSFIFLNQEVEVLINDKRTALIKSKEFFHKLILLWIGVPPNSELKEGLLGLSS